jgi:hypothetical protein
MPNYMKTKLIILQLIIGINLFGQTYKNNVDFKKVTFGLGFHFSLESMDKVIMEKEGISDIGITYFEPFLTMNFLRYLNLNTGLSLSYFKDNMPFQQAVLISYSGLFSNLPGDAKSKLTTTGYYYSVGSRVPIISGLNIVGNFGRRNLTFTRAIKHCDNCNEQRLYSKSNYIQAGFSWVGIEDKGEELMGQIDLLYSQYLNSANNYSISIGFNGYF